MLSTQKQSQRFKAFLDKATQVDLELSTFRMLVLDPGETTGVAMFVGAEVIDTIQLNTKNRSDFSNQFHNLCLCYHPDMILFEDYRVYSWRSKQHNWADLHTAKLIGHIECMCQVRDLPHHSQMAHQAKQFCTDDKLKEWNLYIKGEKHSRDAIRHGCYYLLFGAGRS